MESTKQAERIDILDALRGFALGGILLANLTSFFGYSTYTPAEILALPWADRCVLLVIDWVIEGKFYAIFSILFGIGFSLQLRRMTKAGSSFSGYWIKRMLALTCIGLLHMFLIWHGDILTLYSLLGLLLLPFMKKSDRSLKMWMLFLLATPIVMRILVATTPENPFWHSLADWAQTQKQLFGFAERSLLLMRTSDSLFEVFFVNALAAVQRPMSYLQSGRYTEVFGLFLAGVLLGRAWFSNLAVTKGFPLVGWRLLGVLGTILSLGYAVMKGTMGTPYSVDTAGVIQGMLYHLGTIPMALGIMGLFSSLWEREAWRAKLELLAVLGRMALTNYVLQNTLAVLLFFGTGLGLMGQLSFALVPIVAAAIIIVQLLFSRAWMSAHAQGPFEHLWRKAAYSGSN